MRLQVDSNATSRTCGKVFRASSAAGTVAEVDLWTTCFTPRELRLLAHQAGLEVEHVWAVAPGAYAADPPRTDTPELLLIARRP